MPISRAQLSFTDRTASNAVLPDPGHLHIEPPAGLYSQPSQATQEQTQQTGRQPLDLRRTAAITVAIGNVQIRDDDMNVSQEAGPSSRAALLQRGHSTNSRPLTVEVAATRVPSQDMWWVATVRCIPRLHWSLLMRLISMQYLPHPCYDVVHSMRHTSPLLIHGAMCLLVSP